MAYYDPQQQAQVANIFAAQYGVQREAREDEKKDRRTGMVAGAKAGYFLDRGYIQDQRNKAADMMLEKSSDTDTLLKYKRKAYKKPESWKEWLSQRYATPLGTEKGPGRRGALLEEEGLNEAAIKRKADYKEYVDDFNTRYPVSSQSQEELWGSTLEEASTRESKYVNKLFDENREFLKKKDFMPRGRRAEESNRAAAENANRLREKQARKSSSIEGLKQLNYDQKLDLEAGRMSQQAIKESEFSSMDQTGLNWAGPETEIEALNAQNVQAKSGSATGRARLKGLEDYQQQAIQQSTQDLEGYSFTGGGAPGSLRKITDPREGIIPEHILPSTAYDTSYNELVGSETANTNVIQDRWKFGKKANPFGMDPTKGPSDLMPSPVSDPGSGVASTLQNYGANIEKEQLTEWIGAGGSEMPGKSDLGKYLNWQKTAEVPGATDAASTITDEAGEEISGASGLSTGLKVGATLLGSQGQTSQELANTGLETGLDVASSYGLKTGIATGNVPLVAISAGYKLFDFLGGSELFT